MKLKIIAVALLPLLLSGCAEVLSFAAGFGAGYFTGQYMTEQDVKAAKNLKNARMGPPSQPMQGYPYDQQPRQQQSQMQTAAPYGYYANSAFYPNQAPTADAYQQYQQQYQQYYAQQQQMMQQQAQPYGVPQQVNPQASAAQPAMQEQAQVAPQAQAPAHSSPEAQAAEVKIVPATPQAGYQQTPMQPPAPAPAPVPQAQPQMMQPQAMQMQPGGGYYIAPIPMAPLQGGAPMAPPPPGY